MRVLLLNLAFSVMLLDVRVVVPTLQKTSGSRREFTHGARGHHFTFLAAAHHLLPIQRYETKVFFRSAFVGPSLSDEAGAIRVHPYRQWPFWCPGPHGPGAVHWGPGSRESQPRRLPNMVGGLGATCRDHSGLGLFLASSLLHHQHRLAHTLRPTQSPTCQGRDSQHGIDTLDLYWSPAAGRCPVLDIRCLTLQLSQPAGPRAGMWLSRPQPQSASLPPHFCPLYRLLMGSSRPATETFASQSNEFVPRAQPRCREPSNSLVP